MDNPEGSRDFKKKEEEIKKYTETALSYFYPLYWEGIDLLKDAIRLLIEESLANEEQNSITYRKVLLMQLNKLIQHAESMRVLVEAGLCGDAAVIARSMTSDLIMAEYLFYHPELLEMFWNEKENDFQKNPVFKKLFGEGEIDKDFISRGTSSYKKVFNLLSKAVHASAFGSQYFGTFSQNGTGQYHFNYGPKFDPQRALSFSAINLGGILDALISVMVYQEDEGKGTIPMSWKALEKKILRFERETHFFMDIAEETTGILWPKLNIEAPTSDPN